MRLAAIDIGTNTILLLVADLRPDGNVRPVLELQELPRLGTGVDRERHLLPDAMERSVRVLERYADQARRAGAQLILACGTSALRDATNRDEFMKMVGARTGIAVRVLTGREEAHRTYIGAVSDLVSPESKEPCAVLDIGGGSTEIVFGQGRAVNSLYSFDIGAVRLTERCFRDHPPSPSDFAESQALVRAAFETLGGKSGARRLIAVAGTPVTLASILLKLPEFDALSTHGKTFSRSEIEQLLTMLRSMDLASIGKLPQVQQGREDVLLAGTLILVEAMRHLGVEQLQTSARGLRYGMAAVDGMQESL